MKYRRATGAIRVFRSSRDNSTGYRFDVRSSGMLHRIKPGTDHAGFVHQSDSAQANDDTDMSPRRFHQKRSFPALLRRVVSSPLWFLASAYRWIVAHKWLVGGVVVLGLITVFVILPAFVYYSFTREIGTKEEIITRRDGGVTLLDRREQPFFALYEAKNREIVPLEDISIHLQNAVISSEDQEFYNHPGFSITGIARSVVVNLRSNEISQGGSTLTQQLIKNVLLSPERTIWRKYQEIVLAVELERRFTRMKSLRCISIPYISGEGSVWGRTSCTYLFW